MAKEILKRCVIVCASPDADADFIKNKILPDDYVIAADGGIKKLNELKIAPDLFVGDFDSYSGNLPEYTEVIKLNTHKDDTDSMHCASVAVKRGFNSVMLLGASGGSMSHTYSNYSVLSFLADNNITASMADNIETVTVLNEGCYSFDNLKGREFSVFPFGCECVTVSYVGDVEYPAADLAIFENSSLGKSNVFNSDKVEIVIKNGKAIVFCREKD